MAAMISFGADGWSARIDGDFNEENLVCVADAAGRMWAQSDPGAIVYVGFDARRDAERYACLAGRVLASHGLVPMVSDRFCPTPALSWSVARDVRACGGLQVTGSHNPPDYLGVKLRMSRGGTPTDDEIEELERLVDPEPTEGRGGIQRIDMVTPYFDYLCSTVDGDAIARAAMDVVFDPLYGSSRGYVPFAMGALGLNVAEIHGEDDEDAPNVRPDPVEPWVDDCEQRVVELGACAGLAMDGDADRAGAVDERGSYVHPHKIAAIVLKHLVERRGLTGRVVVTQSMSVLLKRVARSLGLRVTVKPVGFRYIVEEMSHEEVLMGAEESGSIAIPQLCPERDGVLTALLVCECMAMTGKTLSELVAELEDEFGRMSYGKRDMRAEPEEIEVFRTLLPGLNPQTVVGRTPVNVSHMDGLKLEFDDGSWLLARPSAAKSVVRVYAEAPTVEQRDELLDAGCDLALGEDPR